MAITPGDHQASSASVPQAGDALASATIRALLNALVGTYNDHDEDGTIHVQSGTLAQRPTSAATNTVYVTTDSPRTFYLWNGSGWVGLDYESSGGSQPDQFFYLFATRI